MGLLKPVKLDGNTVITYIGNTEALGSALFVGVEESAPVLRLHEFRLYSDDNAHDSSTSKDFKQRVTP